MPSWIGRRGRPDDDARPHPAAERAEGTITSSVIGSTAMAATNANASIATGTDVPTLSVPGM